LIPVVVSKLIPGQSSKCKNGQIAITPKLGRPRYGYYALDFCSMRYIFLQGFSV